MAGYIKVGGAIIKINHKTQRNSLELFFIYAGCHSSGIGLAAWKAIETQYPETQVWETVTPYFEKRNINFYVNKCGFHIVEFFNPAHRDPNVKNGEVGGMDKKVGQYFFRFEKTLS